VRSFINLRQANPSVKLLIGVGGAEQKSQIPSKIAETETDRTTSAIKVKEFVDKYGFDGVDFDWQYPGQGTGSKPADKENYVKLLTTWRQTLTSSKILSVSVATRQEDIAISYDIAGILAQVDFINLNSFDLRGSSDDTITAFHSPYRKDISETGNEAEWNAESIVSNWIAKGNFICHTTTSDGDGKK
jgi:chitinase